ncbi:GNAT family N-acetyltransferase [Pelagicoccus albus]|uniref:GNAT family N-acetyltransferase n=1 Tax=Pelagicoccus albus TaxID=415222 RepID=A0A7X1B8P1_9BACT|nr:GNAT family N-acetyltransferase [Pelagicoccus albus]MBC2607737.1 GNAT family N-acetyltransferase [Pelagicoccus albus]
MFSRVVDSDISLSLAIPLHAEGLFQLVDRNRQFLKEWLPWLDSNQSSSDTDTFIRSELVRFSRDEGLLLIIHYKESIAGVTGFNTIDAESKTGKIGYWLGEEFNGLGIMTRAVNELAQIGKELFKLQTLEIRCAPGNSKSKAIPLRLGYKFAGIIPAAEQLYERVVDHEVYQLQL